MGHGKKLLVAVVEHHTLTPQQVVLTMTEDISRSIVLQVLGR